MVSYTGMLLYHKNVNFENETSKENSHHWSEIMSVFSCVEHEPFNLENWDACVYLSLKMEHGFNCVTL